MYRVCTCCLLEDNSNNAGHSVVQQQKYQEYKGRKRDYSVAIPIQTLAGDRVQITLRTSEQLGREVIVQILTSEEYDELVKMEDEVPALCYPVDISRLPVLHQPEVAFVSRHAANWIIYAVLPQGISIETRVFQGEPRNGIFL